MTTSYVLLMKELRQYKNGHASVKKHVCFEIAALFPSPTRAREKGVNFTEMNPFLYCPSSSGKLNNPI